MIEGPVPLAEEQGLFVPFHFSAALSEKPWRERGPSATMVLPHSTVVNRRAKDGHVALACTSGVVGLDTR
jgi:hypothetical protein